VSLDPQLTAIQAILEALRELSDDDRGMVLDYISMRYPRKQTTSISHPRAVISQDAPEVSGTTTDQEPTTSLVEKFSVFGELLDAVGANTDSEKALAASYWLQCHDKVDSIDSQSVNTLLKHTGYAISNITRALDGLGASKPALVVQLKKLGSSQQARKTFRVTSSGEKFVVDRLRASLGGANA
jgi:hypothetical protein